MKVLVTGASGRLGSAVVARLQAAGHEVIAASRSGVAPSAAAVKPLALDLSLEQALPVLRGVLAPDVAVVHLAALRPAAPTGSSERPALLEHNVYGTMRLLEAARPEVAGASVVVYASDAAVYGAPPYDELLDEDSLMTPDSDYAASKLSGEDHLFAFEFEAGTRAVSLRFGQLYGPGQRAPDLFSRLLGASRAGTPWPLLANANDCEPRLHVADAAFVIEQALVSKVSGRFNVADGELHELGSDLALVAEVTGVASTASLESPGRPARRVRLALSRARAELGFEGRSSLADWLREEWRARGGAA